MFYELGYEVKRLVRTRIRPPASRRAAPRQLASPNEKRTDEIAFVGQPRRLPRTSFETDAIGPIGPFFHKACADWILTNVLPFLSGRFIGAEQSIKTAGLPLLLRVSLAPDA